METPSMPVREVSYRRLEARRAWKAEAAAAVRRRELANRYPDINPQAWSNLGPEGFGSMAGTGAGALRAWQESVMAITQALFQKPYVPLNQMSPAFVSGCEPKSFVHSENTIPTVTSSSLTS